jgi:hypothetical protein
MRLHFAVMSEIRGFAKISEEVLRVSVLALGKDGHCWGARDKKNI